MQLGPANRRYRFDGEVWCQPGPHAIYFVSLPTELYDEIIDLVGNSLNPWGTVPVVATVDDFSWDSSMFPRKVRRCYDLPLNARVRRRLDLHDGQLISVRIEITLPG